MSEWQTFKPKGIAGPLTKRALIVRRNEMVAALSDDPMTIGQPPPPAREKWQHDVIEEGDLLMMKGTSQVGDPPRDPCEVEPIGAAFCSGQWHLRRHYMRTTKSWGWAAFTPCPRDTQQKTHATETPRKSRWRG